MGTLGVCRGVWHQVVDRTSSGMSCPVGCRTASLWIELFLIGLGSGEFRSWVKALGLCCIPEHLCDWAGALSHLMRPVLRLQRYYHGRYAWSTATHRWHPHQCQDPRFSSISCNKSITFIKFTCRWCCN